MTVNTTRVVSGPYTGNDVADTFSYGFKINNKTQISVYETNDEGVETLLTVDTHFTINNIGVDTGGTVVRTAGPLPTGYTWYIRSNYQQTQLTAFNSQGGFFPDVHEDAIDKLTILIQQLSDKIDRSPRVSDSYSGSIPLAIDTPSDGKALKWNSAGKLVNYDPFEIDAVSAPQAVIKGDYVNGTELTNPTDAAVLASNGSYWVPKSTASLPITIDATTYPNPEDHVPELRLYSDINSANIADYTNLTFETLNDARSSSAIEIGDYIETIERYSGFGGGGKWTALDSSSVTVNGIDIVQSLSNPSIALKFAESGVVDARQLGLKNDSGTTDNTAILESIDALNYNVVVIDCDAGQFGFASAPSLSNIKTIVSSPSCILGVSVSQLNGVTFGEGGQWGGYLHAKDLIGKQIEVIAGTLRPQAFVSVTGISSSGNIATVTHTNHGYSTSQRVYVTGANESEYNGVWLITVVDANKYTYDMGQTAASPATGSVTVRNLTKWFWIKDANHEPVGVDDSTSVIASGFNLPINFTNTYTKVLSVVCGGDESYSSSLGISVGASVGLSSMILKASISKTMAYHIYYAGGGNWAWARGFGQGDNGTGEDFQIKIDSITHDNLTGVTTITHGCMPGFDVSLTPYSNSPVIGSSVPNLPVLNFTNSSYSPDNFQYTSEIKWVDLSSGSYATTQNAPMSCIFSKSFDGPLFLDGSGGSKDFELHKGNIWFYGIMEV